MKTYKGRENAFCLQDMFSKLKRDIAICLTKTAIKNAQIQLRLKLRKVTEMIIALKEKNNSSFVKIITANIRKTNRKLFSQFGNFSRNNLLKSYGAFLLQMHHVLKGTDV